MNAAPSAKPLDPALDNECINTLRFLSGIVASRTARPSTSCDNSTSQWPSPTPHHTSLVLNISLVGES